MKKGSVEAIKDEIESVAPSYYRSRESGLGDTLDFILDMDLGFCEGNVVKYVVRWQQKGGLNDLFKAREYLTRLIDSVKNEENE